jgi:type IV pilus assembly protein PilM
MRLLRSARRVIALDIGSHSVKLVAMWHTAVGPRLEAVAQCALPPDVMHGHVLRHPEPVGAAIRALLRRTGGRGGTVRMAIPAPAVMMRQLTVQGGGKAQCDAAVVRDAAAHIPAPLEQTVLDYQLLGPQGRDGAVPVLVVAVRRDLVQSYTAAVRAGGVEPSEVDVDVFAIARLVRPRHAAADDVVLVHAGARYAGIIQLHGNALLWIGDVPVDDALAPETLAGAVEHARDLFSPDASAPPAAVLLSGGVAATSGLAPAFAARFGCPVEVIDPLAGLTAHRGVRRAVDDAGGPAFAVAAGLALRPPEERT